MVLRSTVVKKGGTSLGHTDQECVHSLGSITHNRRKYTNIKRKEAERDPEGAGWDSRSVNYTRFCAYTQTYTCVHVCMEK